ncbi:MAG: BT1926 family outer membrane beta-barrel protein [Bacteroidales bacterium]|nr:BT1926 family outer membrane beta-barrel protein [Bacteroidales bacterium]MDD4030936.1 BT1926 family outer membrane beta-barrel protein [Bacteroidales bacterium]MDD4435662.1 BT1926 family outer membrane beta-barrel protein [Bacteroidales bacterium]MDD5732223.1 BT1926 family outer membrane beta-barrel protein [Bacteroidales bacterium]
MIKKLSIFLIAVLTVASLGAQPAERSGSAVYAPRAGQVQVSAVLGSGLYFDYLDNLTPLLPSYMPGDELGIDPTQKGVGYYLQMGSLDNNPIVNLAGIQGKFFVTNRFALNAMFAMQIDVTPQRDYIEGINLESSGLLDLGGIQWVEGRLTDKYLVNVGADYYFNNCNGRLFPYIGVLGGFQHARVQAYLPYTGIEVPTETGTDPIELYALDNRAGEAYAISGAITAGVEYNLLPGMNIALEVRPFNYYYTAIRMYADGQEYNAYEMQFKFFAFPQLKIGFRF